MLRETLFQSARLFKRSISNGHVSVNVFNSKKCICLNPPPGGQMRAFMNLAAAASVSWPVCWTASAQNRPATGAHILFGSEYIDDGLGRDRPLARSLDAAKRGGPVDQLWSKLVFTWIGTGGNQRRDDLSLPSGALRNGTDVLSCWT